MQQDVAAANARQAETEQALSSWQGSFGGDLAYNAVTLLTRGGNDLIAGVESVKDVLTDGAPAAQAVTGLGNMLWDVGSAVAHPVNAYNQAVNGMSNWLEEPLDQQAQDIGRFGIDALVFGGAEGIATKGLGYIDTLADGFGSAVDALSTEPMYGSRAAQAGMLDVGTVDPQAAIRSRVLGNIAESQAAREASNFGGGLLTDAVQIPERSFVRLLENRGLDANTIQSIRETFDGPVFARHGLVGDELTITESSLGTGSGNFLTWDSAGPTPAIRRAVLSLPDSNLALVESNVSLARPQILLEGRVAAQRNLPFGPWAAGGGWQVVTDGGFMNGAIWR